jgi:hypothetical protein
MLIGEMLAADLQPFTLVEDVGFLRLMAHLTPRYTVPSRKYFTTNILPSIHQRLKDRIQLLVSAGASNGVAITTDMWSCETQSFICVTAHFAENEWQRSHFVLSHAAVDVTHTGINLHAALHRVLQE